ncbi:MAG: peptidase M20, partial [Candidatus Bipolaricaulia bacterium]
MNFLKQVDWKAYREEAVEFLSELIRIDTSNPPGNETEAARFLQERFAREGIAGEILEPEPGRGSFLARLEGQGPGPRLMLLSHTDVVPVADPARWEHPPFSGA